jgi:hypothetical protein
MDAQRFDTLVRTLGVASRRHAVRLLVGGALGGLLARFGLEEAVATHGCRHTGANCTRPGQCCTGRCAGNGTCQPCRRASQCPSPPASEPCKQRVCTNTGTCVIKNKAKGTGCGGDRVCCGGACRLPEGGSDGDCFASNEGCCPNLVCQETKINGAFVNACCKPEGASCTADSVCCFTNCDPDTGKCKSCQGRECDTEHPCCPYYAEDCENGFCGGCAPKGWACSAERPCCPGEGACEKGFCGGCVRTFDPTDPTSGNPPCPQNGAVCCDTDCTEGVCASEQGGPCARDVDCFTCWENFPDQCTDACVAGECAF